jgi:hypothetical protein
MNARGPATLRPTGIRRFCPQADGYGWRCILFPATAFIVHVQAPSAQPAGAGRHRRAVASAQPGCLPSAGILEDGAQPAKRRARRRQDSSSENPQRHRSHAASARTAQGRASGREQPEAGHQEPPRSSRRFPSSLKQASPLQQQRSPPPSDVVAGPARSPSGRAFLCERPADSLFGSRRRSGESGGPLPVYRRCRRSGPRRRVRHRPETAAFRMRRSACESRWAMNGRRPLSLSTARRRARTRPGSRRVRRSSAGTSCNGKSGWPWESLGKPIAPRRKGTLPAACARKPASHDGGHGVALPAAASSRAR